MEYQLGQLRVEFVKLNKSMASIAGSLEQIVTLAKDDFQPASPEAECCGKCHGSCTEPEGGTPE